MPKKGFWDCAELRTIEWEPSILSIETDTPLGKAWQRLTAHFPIRSCLVHSG